jgi:hypothetical protein
MRVHGDDDGAQLKALAAEWGITTQAISAIQQRALAKLRAECERRGIRPEDLFDDAKESDVQLSTAWPDRIAKLVTTGQVQIRKLPASGRWWGSIPNAGWQQDYATQRQLIDNLIVALNRVGL